jgi:branched-chain amino acid transport system permease protein
MFDFVLNSRVIIEFRMIFVIAALGHYLSLSINMLDVAIAGYMGIGAYTSAVLTRNFGAPFSVALVVGGLVSACFALGIDYMGARVKLKGFAFAIVTIGFAEITRVILLNLEYTGGSQGFRQIMPETTLPILVTVLLLVIVLFMMLKRSYLGRACDAIRDDEVAAEAMGINILATKLFVGALGAFLGGLSGGLYAHYALFLEPDQFGFNRLIEIQLPVVFGGLETFWGPIFGTTFLGLLPEVLRLVYNYRLIAYAVLTIIVILVRPQGIISRAMVDRVTGWLFSSFRALAGDRGGELNGTELVGQERGAARSGSDDGPARAVAEPDGWRDGPILVVDRVTRRFGGLDALREVTIKIMPRCIHAVIGPNGAGKTTLFNIVSGALPVSEGKVYFKAQDITGIRSDHIARRGIGRTFQNVRVFKGLTVLENVLVGAHKKVDVGFLRLFLRNPFGVTEREQVCHRRAVALVEFVGLTHVMDRRAGELPLAEQRKVELARALAGDPEVLLLDEQTAGMNRAEKDEICRLVRTIVGMGTTVIFVEHDMRVVMDTADVISVLNFGKLIAEGPPARVRANPEVIEAYLGRE